jgi:hypothetical protein
MRKSFVLSSIILTVLCVITFTVYSQDYTFKISRVVMRKTPQSGTWKAGVNLSVLYYPPGKDYVKNEFRWHGGEQTFEGFDATLPVKFSATVPMPTIEAIVFIAIDDEAANAGGYDAEDKKQINFKPLITEGKEKWEEFFIPGEWHLFIYYTFTKNQFVKARVRQ